MESKQFKKKYFTIEDNTPYYPGYTRGERWNGWACPRFTKEVGLQIAKDTGIEDYYLVFDEENDRFVYHDCNDEPNEHETFEGTDIVVDTDIIHVYPIGAWSWVWQSYDYAYTNELLVELLTERLTAVCDGEYTRVVNDLGISGDITPDQTLEFEQTFNKLVSQYMELIKQNGGLK